MLAATQLNDENTDTFSVKANPTLLNITRTPDEVTVITADCTTCGDNHEMPVGQWWPTIEDPNCYPLVALRVMKKFTFLRILLMVNIAYWKMMAVNTGEDRHKCWVYDLDLVGCWKVLVNHLLSTKVKLI